MDLVSGKSKFFFQALFLIIVLISCSKEKSLETGGAGGNNGGNPGQISRIEVTGLQNSVADFSYDSKNKLVRYNVDAKSIAGALVTTFTCTRDASERISRSIEDYSGSTSQQFITDFYYASPTDTKVKYGMRSFELAGLVIEDSILFTYANNKVTKTYHYYSFDSGKTYLDFTYTTYAYDGRGNIIETAIYQDAGSGFEIVQKVKSEFDTKVNPGSFTDDALIESSVVQYYGPNNPLKQTTEIPLDPSSNFTLAATYEYRTDGKPSKAAFTTPFGALNASFIYK